jgi:hypothetical protein
MSQVLQGAFPQDANPGMSVLQQNGTWAFDETYRLECVKEEGKNPLERIIKIIKKKSQIAHTQYKYYTKRQSRMENADAHATSDTRHRSNTNKTESFTMSNIDLNK